MIIDIGCNTGELTFEMYREISKLQKNIKIIGIDIDETLVMRANITKQELKYVFFLNIKGIYRFLSR